jgi:hypothetical protein
MYIYNKEQMQELDQVADERLVWEYISCKNDIKKSLISEGHADINNVDSVFQEYISLKEQEMRNEYYCL